MDATAERLIEALQNLEREEWRIAQKINAVQTALRLAGVALPLPAAAGEIEQRYARSHCFAGKRLTDSCERIVKDHQGEWVAKRWVVYLLESGGHVTRGKLVNSVDVTLRALAARGRIEAKRTLGRDGNRYRWMPASLAAATAGSGTPGSGPPGEPDRQPDGEGNPAMRVRSRLRRHSSN